MSLSHQALRTITRDVAKVSHSPPEGVCIRVEEGNIGADGGIIGIIRGPEGTPYAGGYFNVSFSFAGLDYPNQPPKCTMRTKMFHPNISKSGEICVDTLKKAWTRNLGIADVLVTVKCLLIHPNPESALDEEAGRLLLEDYEAYAKMARMMTKIHAHLDIPPEEFTDDTTTEKNDAISALAGPAQSNSVPFIDTHSASQMANTPQPVATTPVLKETTLSKPDVSKPKAPLKMAPRRGLKRL